MKILRDQPATLQGAVAVATNEQNLRARVQMSHHSLYTSNHTQHTQHTQTHTKGGWPLKRSTIQG